MLNSKSTKIIFVLFVAVLVQAAFLASSNITEVAWAQYYGPGDSRNSDCGGSLASCGGGDGGGSSCPRGTTNVSGSCCPNQYVNTSTSGSGKGRTTTRTCNPPPPPPPPPPPTVTVSQTESTTAQNESFVVTYGRRGGGPATSCVLQRSTPESSSYSRVHANSGGTSNVIQALNNLGTWNYRALCTGAGGTSNWSTIAHKVVNPPPTLSFTADQYLIPYNTSTSLNWTSQNTVACTASGAWSGSKPVDGSESTGNLVAPTTYFLQCHNNNDQYTNPAAVTINIKHGTGADIIVDPSIVRRNNPVTVTWDTGTSDPANCQIQIGSITLQSPLTSPNGSFIHAVRGETTFTIDCEDGLNTDEATVNVLPEFQEI